MGALRWYFSTSVARTGVNHPFCTSLPCRPFGLLIMCYTSLAPSISDGKHAQEPATLCRIARTAGITPAAHPIRLPLALMRYGCSVTLID